MTHIIRHYQQSDFDNLSTWWLNAMGMQYMPSFFSEEGTFILELDGTPALSVTILMSQCKDVAHLVTFIKNPFFKEQDLESFGVLLLKHVSMYAKHKGYKNFVCFTDNEKLKEKYQRFGMTNTMNNLSGFILPL